MRTKLILSAIAVACASSAFGCASESDARRPRSATHETATTTSVVQKKPEISPINRAKRAEAPMDLHHHGPISLTGDVPYAERYDASGWSGTSTPPEGIGGGPLSTESAENPYDENPQPNATPTPSPATDSLSPTPPTNDQKDLDTTPAAPTEPPPQ